MFAHLGQYLDVRLKVQLFLKCGGARFELSPSIFQFGPENFRIVLEHVSFFGHLSVIHH